MNTCILQHITQPKIDRFNSSETMWLFNTNKDNYIHNINQLKILNQPIILINADHDSPSSASNSDDIARKL